MSPQSEPIPIASHRPQQPRCGEILLGDMAERLKKRFPDEGIQKTAVPYLSIMRSDRGTPIKHGIQEPALCLVVQGDKRIYIGKEVTDYSSGSYFVSSVAIPTSGQVARACCVQPYLGIRIELDPREIVAVIMDAKFPIPSTSGAGSGAFVGTASEELLGAFQRLIRLLDSPEDMAFLAPGIKREILYFLLKSAEGSKLYDTCIVDFRDLGVGRAVNWIRQHFDQTMKVEVLAEEVSMSVSSFHRKFKAVMTMGPLQYQKQLRLLEARRLMLAGAMDAASAGYEVGYESASQFNREYHRLFGAPPLKDALEFKRMNSAEWEAAQL